MRKVELLAPAGNLQKLKIAFAYGADDCIWRDKHLLFENPFRERVYSLRSLRRELIMPTLLGKKSTAQLMVFHLTLN